MKVVLGILLSFALCVDLAGAPARAATTGAVRGEVVNAATGSPIAGAAVSLISSSTSYTATTDARGFYSIVGVIPGTYRLSVQKDGFSPFSTQAGEIAQDTTTVVNARLSATGAPAIIATVTSRSATFPVQRNQPNDVYVVNPLMQEQLGGVPAYENEGQLLNALPGVTPVGGGSSGTLANFPTIRGGLENDAGYQLDGINATEPLTNEFINNLILNGAQNLVLTAGPGDASQGGSGSGYINVVTKTGTYPASGFLQLEGGGPAFEHNVAFEYGTATEDHRYSLFVSGRYDRDFGGCCAPPYGNVYGAPTGAYPDTLGQVNFNATNDTVVNGIIHFGRGNANAIQLWGEWGANELVGGYGINPSTYPYTTNTPAYYSIYQEAPLLVGGQAPLTQAQAQALMPFYPGQTSAMQSLGSAPAETTNFDLMKIAWSRAIGNNAFVNARIYRTQNWVVDASNDANDPLFGYGLPTVGFGDFYVTRATQNTGFASDLQFALGEKNELTAGFDYRFSHAYLTGTLPSPSLFFAGTTIADFLPQDPLLGGAPGVFAGDRYPALEETIDDPMHRTSFYVADQWNVTDRLLVNPGLRWEQQTVPTPAGLFEANQLEPRIAAALTLGSQRNTVLRASYGHAATFAPLFQIETQYTPPAMYQNYPATQSICGGPSANFSGPCTNYYDQLYNAWWKGYGLNPFNFTRPQQSDSFDFSYERQLSASSGLKVTFYDRRDYNVIVDSQQVTIVHGTVEPGTTAITNDGKAQTAGLELQGYEHVARGLTVIVNGTYINQFVNYISSNAFRPSVDPALLATGEMFHPSYFSPLTLTATLDYRSNGWRIDPIVSYNRGYPVGIWGAPPVFLNGVPVNVPNTNLFNTFGNEYCYYVDPQVPGTATNPNIVGSTGGGCGASANSALTHPMAIFDLAVSKEFAKRLTLGIEVHNLLNNTANYPYYNPGYVNNGFGVSGPGSGTNPAFNSGLPGAAAQYPGTPFFTIPSGSGRQVTVYLRVGV